MFEKTVAKIQDFVDCKKYARKHKSLVKFVDKFVGDRQKFSQTSEFRIKDGRRYHVEIREIH